MQEALSSAQSIATRLGHPELRPAHVLQALLSQDGGLAGPLLEKMGTSPDALKSALDQFLTRQPSVSGSTALAASNDLRVVLTAAEDEQNSLRDDFLSVEHFLLGLFRKPGELGDLLKAQGITHTKAREALSAVRGAQRVTDQDPEGKYQTLEKYGTDLTARPTSQRWPHLAPHRRRPGKSGCGER
jgi:ATP-dependent Clp protease ATP-binding subunit ClpB